MGAELVHRAMVYKPQRNGCTCRAAPCGSAMSPLLPRGSAAVPQTSHKLLEAGEVMTTSCPISASSKACLWHCNRAAHSFVAILRPCETGRPKGLGMKTSPCLHYCLVYGEPLQPYGVTHIPPGVPTITQPCRIHCTSISRYSCTSCAITSSKS